MPPEERGAFDLVEGFHLASALAALREAGILQAMTEPVPSDSLAAQFELDPVILRCVLQYLAAATDLIEGHGDRFRVSDDWDDHAGFLVDQYLGAYGPNAAHLDQVLRQPQRAPALVNRQRHAEAFERLGRPGVALLPGLIRQLELGHVLDLGCGPGALLIELAQADPDFEGWGVDASATMCAKARSHARELGLAGQVKIFEGDAAWFAECVPEAELEQVRTVVAASLLNEFFGAGSGAATEFLRETRKRLPGRALLVSDYYGCLGQPDGRWFRQTALHDFVQVISGQGVPPPNVSAWQCIYEQAGCALVHAFEDDHASGFVHVVRL